MIQPSHTFLDQLSQLYHAAVEYRNVFPLLLFGWVLSFFLLALFWTLSSHIPPRDHTTSDSAICVPRGCEVDPHLNQTFLSLINSSNKPFLHSRGGKASSDRTSFFTLGPIGFHLLGPLHVRPINIHLGHVNTIRNYDIVPTRKQMVLLRTLNHGNHK
ncbi:unnamed protein product [Ectocarpus sp. 4 AP-2014]